MDEIRGYKILNEQTASSGKLFFAERWGKRYVVKEFLSYRFPTDEGVECPELLKGVERRAEQFFNHLCKTTEHIRRNCREDGLLNVSLEVFRQGKMIYKVSKLIESCDVEVDQLHVQLTPAQMNVLLKTILLQLEQFDRISFIHGDVKPENVVISRRGDVYTGGIIDYDTGFIAGGDVGEYVEYTPEYASPESILMHLVMDASPSEEELREAVEQVHCSTDIFAMACVFCQMLTGSVWVIEDEGGDPVSPGRQMLQGWPIRLPWIHPAWRGFLRQMAAADPAARPKPRAVIDGINACIVSGAFKEMVDPYAGLRAYELVKKAPPVCDSNMRIAARKGRNRRVLIWHVEDCWQLPHSFRRQPESVRRLRREHAENLTRLEKLATKVGGLSVYSKLLQPFKVYRQGKRVFAVQNKPKGKLLSLDKLHTLATPEEIDRMMIALLGDLQRCHDAGLMHGCLDRDSLWIADGGKGQLHLFLAGSHRLYEIEQLPHGSRIDASPELLAPEMAKYMTASSEEIRNDVKDMISGRADVFSLGLIYHLMLTGKLPAISDEACTCYAMAAEENAIRLKAKIGPERAKIIRRMISYEPEDRLQSCAEAAQLIDRAYSGTCAQEAENELPPEMQEGSLEELVAEPVSIKAPPAPARKADVKPAPKETNSFFEQDLPDEFLDYGDELLGDEMAVSEEEVFFQETELVQNEALEEDDEWIAAEFGTLSDEYEVADYSELPSGFLQQPARKKGSRSQALLRPLLPRIDQMKENASCFEARREAWNHVAEKKGLIRVEDVRQHEGVLYGVSPYAGEMWGQLANVDFAASSRPQVLQWINSLLEQLGALHQRELQCSLISPGEVLFVHRSGAVQALLHGFDHIRRAGSREDTEQWAMFLRGRYLREECSTWAVDQPMAYLSPEAWEVVFENAAHKLTSASDLFCMGVLLHVMLCGRIPVSQADNWRDAFARGRVVLDENLSFPWRWLIGQMLAEDPRKRPASCAEVQNVIKEIIEQESKRRTVTVKQNDVWAVGKTVSLYAMAGDKEYFVAEAKTNRNGRAAFTGYMPPAFTYEVRCEEIRQTCRWRLE